MARLSVWPETAVPRISPDRRQTDTTIRVDFTDVDAAKDEFFELCSNAGEDVADLVVG